MSWRRTSTPSEAFLGNTARLLVAKMRSGYTLEGTICRKGEFVEHGRQDVIDFAVAKGMIRADGGKPVRYELPE